MLVVKIKVQAMLTDPNINLSPIIQKGPQKTAQEPHSFSAYYFIITKNKASLIFLI